MCLPFLHSVPAASLSSSWRRRITLFLNINASASSVLEFPSLRPEMCKEGDSYLVASYRHRGDVCGSQVHCLKIKQKEVLVPQQKITIHFLSFLSGMMQNSLNVGMCSENKHACVFWTQMSAIACASFFFLPSWIFAFAGCDAGNCGWTTNSSLSDWLAARHGENWALSNNSPIKVWLSARSAQLKEQITLTSLYTSNYMSVMHSGDKRMYWGGCNIIGQTCFVMALLCGFVSNGLHCFRAETRIRTYISLYLILVQFHFPYISSPG